MFTWHLLQPPFGLSAISGSFFFLFFNSSLAYSIYECNKVHDVFFAQFCRQMEPSLLLFTFHVYVSDGAQQAHIIVVVVAVEARVGDDLHCSVTSPQKDVCDDDCVHQHHPVTRCKRFFTAETAV